MKKLTRFFIFCFIVTLSICLFEINLTALTTTKDDAGSYNYTTSSETEIGLSNSVKYIKNEGYTTRSSTKYSQVTHIFSADMTNTQEDVKVVTWGIKNSTNTGFDRNTLLEIAKDYEENNPGWMILCGINSDQFYTKYGNSLGTNGSAHMFPQPYYPMISGGENWFSINPYASCNNVVGFKNDNSLNQMVYGTRSIAGFKVHILDDNKNIIKTFDINDLNIFSELGANQTTVIAPTKDTTVNQWKTVTKSSSNGFYIIENSDLSYVSNSIEYITTTNGTNVNAFFGKGKISKIDDNVSLTGNQFAIETTNEELKNALNVGTYVRCEYEFDNGFDGIEEASGFHTVQRLNGKDQNVANSYNSRAYPRSVMGFDTTSGKVYFITCDGSNSAPTKGLYAQEVNALCKQYNITDAFQQDGGGSVTSVYRDESGDLKYAQDPIEAAYRSIAYGVFMVIKTQNIKVDVEEASSDELVFNVDSSLEETKYDKMYLEININDESKLFEVIDGKVIVTNLESNTNYSYYLWLEQNGQERFKSLIKGSAQTHKLAPSIEIVSYSEHEDGIYLEIKYNDKDASIYRISAIINGKAYNVTHKDGVATLKIDKDTNNFLDIMFKVECYLSKDKERIEITEFKVEVETMLVLKNITSAIEDFIDEILK